MGLLLGTCAEGKLASLNLGLALKEVNLPIADLLRTRAYVLV